MLSSWCLLLEIHFTLVVEKHDRRRKFFHRRILLLQLLPNRLLNPLELLSHHFQA